MSNDYYVTNEHRVGALSLVSGRKQTHLVRDAAQNEHVASGALPWFHDVLHPDGRPFYANEADFRKRITGKLGVAPAQAQQPFGAPERLGLAVAIESNRWKNRRRIPI